VNSLRKLFSRRSHGRHSGGKKLAKNNYYLWLFGFFAGEAMVAILAAKSQQIAFQKSEPKRQVIFLVIYQNEYYKEK